MKISLYKTLTFVILFFLSSVTLAEKNVNYKKLSSCQKMNYLWQQIEKTDHLKGGGVLTQVAPMAKFGAKELIKMGWQGVTKKRDLYSDFSPKGWVKYIHRRAVVAKVKIVPHKPEGGTNKFSGVLKEAPCALLRLSVTYKPLNKKGRGFAPGLALKILRDDTYSVNVSALYKLDGQEQNFNFFENALSNIVPFGGYFAKSAFVHGIFRAASDYPEQLKLYEMTHLDLKGKKIENPQPVYQVFFVPNRSLFSNGLSEESHDFRNDFLRVLPGKSKKLYDIYAVPDKGKEFRNSYIKYKEKHISEFLGEAVSSEKNLIASIYLQNDSKFSASSFGDDGLFFRHEVRFKKNEKDK